MSKIKSANASSFFVTVIAIVIVNRGFLCVLHYSPSLCAKYLEMTTALPLIPPLQRGTQYTLSHGEMLYCHHIAGRRIEANEAKGTTVMTYSTKTDYQCHFQGVVGEFIMLRFLEALQNRPTGCLTQALNDTRCRNVTNDTFDATLPSGKKLDVKCTPATDKIVVGDWKRPKVTHGQNVAASAGSNIIYVLISLHGLPKLHQDQPPLHRKSSIPQDFICYDTLLSGTFQGAISADTFWDIAQPFVASQASKQLHQARLDTSSNQFGSSHNNSSSSSGGNVHANFNAHAGKTGHTDGTSGAAAPRPSRDTSKSNYFVLTTKLEDLIITL